MPSWCRSSGRHARGLRLHLRQDRRGDPDPDHFFWGAAVISQVRLFNTHPTGATLKEERLDALMEPGGIADCGNAQNCERVCPKEIPLVRSIAEVNREITKEILFGWLKK